MGNLIRTKFKERITSEISPAQFPRKPSTARSASLHKGINECAPRIPKRSPSLHKGINDDAPCIPKRQERALGRRRGSGTHGGQDSTGRDIGPRTSKSSSPPDDIKILPARRAGQQNFEGLLWGRRIWQPWPISYQAQGPCRGGRNIQEWTNKVQNARRRCRGQSCSRQIEIMEGESSTPPRTVS